MISVLLPSRNRPQSLIRSVASLVDRLGPPLAPDHPRYRDPGWRAEILIGFDQDDDQTRAESWSVAGDLRKLCEGRAGLHMRVFPERHGYRNLHRYYNELASHGNGDWFLVWNDDAFMTTDRWGNHIEQLPQRIVVADLQSQLSPHLCCFPAVRSWAVQTVGGFSPHISHADTYWQDLGRALDAIHPVPVQVNHDRADITGGHNDRTRAESVTQYRSGEYYSEPIQALLQADIDKLRAELTRRGLDPL